MATIARLTVDLVANSARFNAGLNTAEKRSDRFFRNLQNKSQRAVKHFAAVGAAAAAVFVGSSLRTAGQFAAAMSDVQAKTQASAHQIDGLSRVLRNAAAETRFTATQTGEAATFLAQAGLHIREISEAVRPTLDAAAATGASVQQTADIVTNVMRGMSIEVADLGRATDVLALTTASSNTNLIELGEAFKYGASSAVSMGLSVEETASLFGTFANAGIKASMAGTALSQAFTKLAREGSTTELALANATGGLTAHQAALQRLGVATADSNGEMRNFIDILRDLQDAGASEEDIVDLFGARPARALITVLREGLDSVDQLTMKLQQAGGAAQRMASVQMDNLPGDIQLMGSALEEMKLTLVEGGLMAATRSFIQTVRDGIVSMTPYIKEFVAVLASIGGTVVTAALVKSRHLILAIGRALLLNPIVWIGGAIGGVIVAWMHFREEMIIVANMLATWVTGAAADLWNWVTGIGRDIKTWLIDNWVKASTAVSEFATAAGDKLRAFGELVYRYTIQPLKDLAQWIYDHLPQSVQDALGWVAEKASTGAAVVGQAISDGISTAGDFAEDLGQDIADVTKAVVTGGEQMIQTAITSAGEYIGAAQAEIQAFIADVTAQADAMRAAATPQQQDQGQGSTGLPKSDEVVEQQKTLQGELQSIWSGMSNYYDQQQKRMVESNLASWGAILGNAGKYSKKMEILNRLMAVRSIVMNTAEAVMVAAKSAPFPANLPGIAFATAQGALQLAAVRGQAHDGHEFLPKTGTYILERGERVLSKGHNEQLSKFLAQQTTTNNSVTNNPVLNFTVNGGNGDEFEEVLRNNRGLLERMMREVYQENATQQPF